MKNRNSMFIAAVVFIALVAAYFGITRYQSWKSEKESAASAASSVMVTSADTGNLIKISYESSGVTYAFSKEDGTWYYDTDRNFPVKQSIIDSMGSAWGQLQAERQLTETDSLSAYGLENPAYTVSMTDTAGTVTTFYIGSQTGSGDYYAASGDKKTVYTVSSSIESRLKYTMSDWIQLDTVPGVSNATLKQVDITKNGATTTYSESDTDALNGIAGGISTFSTASYETYYAAGDTLKQYGLDPESRTTVTYSYTKDDADNSYTLYIGNLDDSGTNYYVQVQNSNIVYKEGKEIVENVLDTNTSDKTTSAS